MNHMNAAGACTCPHHKIGDVIIVLLGLSFLLGGLGMLSAEFVQMAWPILVILYGLSRLISGSCRCYAQS